MSRPRGWDDDRLRDYAADAVRAAVSDVDPAILDELTGRLSTVSGDYGQPDTFASVAARLAAAAAQRPVHYLAIPPVRAVVHGLAGAGLPQRACVVVEKPFRRDLAWVQELNGVLHRVFDERLGQLTVGVGERAGGPAPRMPRPLPAVRIPGSRPGKAAPFPA